MSNAQVERIMLGFACGFAFNYWWNWHWDFSWFSGIVVANWILQTGQLGEAKFNLLELGQSWRRREK